MIKMTSIGLWKSTLEKLEEIMIEQEIADVDVTINFLISFYNDHGKEEDTKK